MGSPSTAATKISAGAENPKPVRLRALPSALTLVANLLPLKRYCKTRLNVGFLESKSHIQFLGVYLYCPLLWAAGSCAQTCLICFNAAVGEVTPARIDGMILFPASTRSPCKTLSNI
jgi:hypothetical protein